MNLVSITDSQDKKQYENSLASLFEQTFSRPLRSLEWNMLFECAPYGGSVTILCIDNEQVVGCANFVPQRLKVQGKVYQYYLFTTSMVDEAYRTKGVYFKLISEMKQMLKASQYDFILAFPNELAYPLVTSSLVGFKAVATDNMVSLGSLEEVDSSVSYDEENSILLDKAFFDWRLKRDNYFLAQSKSKLLLCKEYGEAIDILEVFDGELDAISELALERKNISAKESYNLLSRKDNLTEETQVLNKLNLVMFSHSPEYYMLDIQVSLLAWDIV